MRHCFFFYETVPPYFQKKSCLSVRPIRASISVNIDVSVGLFSLLSPVLVEDAGEDDLLRRDVTGINCRAFVLKSGYCGFCIPPP